MVLHQIMNRIVNLNRKLCSFIQVFLLKEGKSRLDFVSHRYSSVFLYRLKWRPCEGSTSTYLTLTSWRLTCCLHNTETKTDCKVDKLCEGISGDMFLWIKVIQFWSGNSVCGSHFFNINPIYCITQSWNSITYITPDLWEIIWHLQSCHHFIAFYVNAKKKSLERCLFWVK